MLLSAGLLALLSVLLAWPIPVTLSRSRWPSRAPGLALIVWQAIAVAGVLSVVGALLTFGVSGLGDTLLQGLSHLFRSLGRGTVPEGLGALHVFALSVAVLFAGHLLLSLSTTFFKAERERRRQHDLIALLSSRSAQVPGTRVLEHTLPIAYCLPGAFRTATVLTDGLMRMLSDDELSAVVAHERAHLSQQHHLLLLAFRAWRKALPWFPIATRTSSSVGLLVEMAADDAAARAVSTDAVLSAIVTVAEGGGGSSDIEEDMPNASPASRRVERLLEPQRPLTPIASSTIVALSALLVVLPPLLLLSA